jgi:O-acetyl-ADP-ribose deacetylase (regulator of RNase III)
MIRYVQGDLLTADVEGLVNAVNCVGVMGKGLALQFKQAYPDNFKQYARACKSGEVKPGCMFIVPTNRSDNPKFVINFPTKRHWRDHSRIDDIKAGLLALIEETSARKIASLAVPPLGCGLGGLKWSEVKPLIEEAFLALPDVEVLIFEPQ